MVISSDSPSSSDDDGGPGRRQGAKRTAIPPRKQAGGGKIFTEERGGDFSDSDSSLGSDGKPLYTGVHRDPTVNKEKPKNKGRKDSVQSQDNLKAALSKPIGQGAMKASTPLLALPLATAILRPLLLRPSSTRRSGGISAWP